MGNENSHSSDSSDSSDAPVTPTYQSSQNKCINLPRLKLHDASSFQSSQSKCTNLPQLKLHDTSSLQPPQHSTIRSSNLSEIVSYKECTPSSTPKSCQKSDFPLLTSFPSISKQSPNQPRISLLNVSNGITGKYISSRICKIAAEFWQQNIENLSVDEQLEIGCSIFFGMLSTNNEMKKVMKNNFVEDQKIENISLRYLDMMGWLIRYLITDNIELCELLSKLGILHRKFGIHIQHFDPMLQSMHQTFAYYFETKYSIEVKYAMDEIFSLAAQLMTGENLNGHLNDITQQFQGDKIPFLTNLQTCLNSCIGREYLYRYLSTKWCDEMAIFLHLLFRFKHLMTNKERFIVAKDIIRTSIKSTATFAINISYEARINALNAVDKLEQCFKAGELLEINIDFFSEVEMEIYRLLKANYWNKFVESIENLQTKSFDV